MKMCIKKSFVLLMLVGALDSIPVGWLHAQTFKSLYSFTGGSDGSGPWCSLTVSGNTLFGTTSDWPPGSSGNGTVFALNTDGTGFTTLYSFTGASDGANPFSTLILSGNVLYGTATAGGSSGSGTVFVLNVDGTGFTALYSFTAISGSTNTDGSDPRGGLLLSGTTLYGAAQFGGAAGNGTLFDLNTDGTGFTNLYTFTEIATNSLGVHANSDGALPNHLVVSSNTLFGTAAYGGSSNSGTVFRLNTNGSGFTALHSFTGASTSGGAQPTGGVILSGNTLFGTTFGNGGIGGTTGLGTVFAVNTDGSGFKTLHTFTVSTYNSEGCCPEAGLILSGTTLYGTASEGGSSLDGTVFKINTDGTGFNVLHSFSGSDGSTPRGGLLLSGNTLFGTTYSGGSSGYGTIFSISLPGIPPQLTITPAGANVVLSWPASATGFNLQSTTNLSSPVWTTNLPAVVVVNGQYTVTNPISGAQQFFRLSQ
jgi:uncharacterized repeat protein (TIGR03803 family)